MELYLIGIGLGLTFLMVIILHFVLNYANKQLDKIKTEYQQMIDEVELQQFKLKNLPVAEYPEKVEIIIPGIGKRTGKVLSNAPVYDSDDCEYFWSYKVDLDNQRYVTGKIDIVRKTH